MDAQFRTEEFERHRGGRLGAPVRAIAETVSTNTDALAWALEGASEGAVVVADTQTAGRGRWGRSWIDNPGESLLFSMVLRPVFDPSLLTTALGVAVCTAIESTTGAVTRIKWPNDVTIGGYKIAGILVDARSGENHADALAAGVGVNISWREVPAELSGRASSLLLTTGRAPDREVLLAAILTSFEPRYDALAAGDRGVLVDAAARSETVGNRVRVVRPGGDIVTGDALRLAETGALVVETDDGEIVTFDAGEVELIRRDVDPAD
jgi:BirA family transcriptional regulator, biotin operon repressor / biotin---[acetyl-CoA-carboxylase] ligase